MIRNFIFLVVFLQQYSQNVQAGCKTTTIITTTLAPAVQFELFQEKFKVVYENATVAAQKFEGFSANLAVIDKSNADFAAGKISYTLGINQFADLVSFFVIKYIKENII